MKLWDRSAPSSRTTPMVLMILLELYTSIEKNGAKGDTGASCFRNACAKYLCPEPWDKSLSAHKPSTSLSPNLQIPLKSMKVESTQHVEDKGPSSCISGCSAASLSFQLIGIHYYRRFVAATAASQKTEPPDVLAAVEPVW